MKIKFLKGDEYTLTKTQLTKGGVYINKLWQETPYLIVGNAGVDGYHGAVALTTGTFIPLIQLADSGWMFKEGVEVVVK